MKRNKWQGHKLTEEEKKAIDREYRNDVAASLLILVLAIIAGIIVLAFIWEILL